MFCLQKGSTEDDTALNQADIVQEAPKPPPRIRTPEEVAAGLERQKAAVNAIRNTPEKRAATRAMAPVEIPSATTSNAYSTAPVDRSGANRADRSGGKLKGMFKGKGPSIPGFKSKRNAGSPSDNAVVSSAPVEVTPEIDGGNGINDGAGVNTALAPETKKGGKFKGMFKRGSGKAKIASPARDLPARSSLGQAGAPHEVELSDQAELSDEPVLNDESATSYSDHAPAQHQQQLPAGYSGMPSSSSALSSQRRPRSLAFCWNHGSKCYAIQLCILSPCPPPSAPMHIPWNPLLWFCHWSCRPSTQACATLNHDHCCRLAHLLARLCCIETCC